MTAAFLAILVAVVSGAAGAWLQTNHERKEADRSRRISGADDFAVPASGLETACRNYGAVISAWRDDSAQDPIACGSDTQRWSDYARRAQQFDDEFEALIDATYAATFRIGILFTNASGVYEAAARVPYRLGISKMAYFDASPSQAVPA
jgi:hypothetical protein